MVKLGKHFLHILVCCVSLDDIYDLMALFIIYVMMDRVISISIGNRCVSNEFLGKSCSHMRLSCLYQI